MYWTPALGLRWRVTALAAAALALTGCGEAGEVLRFDVDPHSPQYVRGQIVDAMQSAGYQQVWFFGLDTRGERVPEVRSSKELEFRFERAADVVYVARVYFDIPRSALTVRLGGRGGDSLGERGRVEIERLRESMRNKFGSYVAR